MNKHLIFIIAILIISSALTCSSNRKDLKSTENDNLMQNDTTVSSKDSVATMENQDAEYVKGKLYFKLAESTKTSLPDYDIEKPLLGEYPILQQILNNYQIIKIYRAFPEMNTSNMMRMYTIEFSEETNIKTLLQDLNSIESIEYSERIPINQSY